MTNTFDNRTFIPGKQQTFYSAVSPSSTRPDVTNVLWEASSNSPRISASPQASPRPNHPPPSYEESVFNKALANRQNSQTSLHSPSFRYYSNHHLSNSPNTAPPSYASHSSPCTPNDLNHHYRPAPPISARTDGYHPFVSPRPGAIRSNDSPVPQSPHRSSDTKPPPPARMPRMAPTNGGTQFSPNGMRTSTTYLNTNQVYINPPSREQQPAVSTPPPPPPRYPLQPPAIPPRGSPICYQTNAMLNLDGNTMMSPKATIQSVHRSSVMSSTAKRNELIDYKALESRFHSLSIDNDEHLSNSNAFKGECNKCGQLLKNTDDSCEILGQLYHHSCASCVVCGRSVKNKHFVVKNQLYCEEDFVYTGYHQTLEQCIVCHHLITDTVLQAMGQSYHLNCFKCSKCLISLDGVPFVTDKNRNLFCLHDYHMTYAPRCDKCSNPICPENNSNETVRIISMGKTFHVQCYQCQDCSMQLSDEPDRRCYPLGDILLCQGCCRRRLVSARQHYQ